MGMSIDTVDKWLKIQRRNLVDFHETGRDKMIESLDTAMSYLEDYQEFMRKYEKIERIIANNDNDGMIGRLVREVIEDDSCYISKY